MPGRSVSGHQSTAVRSGRRRRRTAGLAILAAVLVIAVAPEPHPTAAIDSRSDLEIGPPRVGGNPRAGSTRLAPARVDLVARAPAASTGRAAPVAGWSLADWLHAAAGALHVRYLNWQARPGNRDGPTGPAARAAGRGSGAWPADQDPDTVSSLTRRSHHEATCMRLA